MMYLLAKLFPSNPKEECARTKTNFVKSDFSIGHRGACMQYPEHTIESYKAAALQGAGIIECDVTFTKDKELICKYVLTRCRAIDVLFSLLTPSLFTSFAIESRPSRPV